MSSGNRTLGKRLCRYLFLDKIKSHLFPSEFFFSFDQNYRFLKTRIELLNNVRRVQRDCYKLSIIDRYEYGEGSAFGKGRYLLLGR